MWVSEGNQINPGAGVILADTGALSAGLLNATIIIWSDANILVNLVQRNALNTTDLHSQKLNVIGTHISVDLPILVGALERIQLVVNTAFTGNVQASILS